MATFGSNRSFRPEVQPASGLSPFSASPLITFKRNRVPENTVAHVGRKAGLSDDIYLDSKAVLQIDRAW